MLCFVCEIYISDAFNGALADILNCRVLKKSNRYEKGGKLGDEYIYEKMQN